MKKCISVFLSIVLTISTFLFIISKTNVNVSAAIDYKCGENTTWYLDTQTGVMTVSGTGYTDDYKGLWDQPFGEFSKYVSSVVVEEGVVGIGNSLFGNLSNCRSVYLPSSLEYIGNNAFHKAISEIIIPEISSLKYFGDYASINETKWFESQPEGVVYLGNCVIGYKGIIENNTIVSLNDKTVSIAPKAFYNQSNLESIDFPESIEFVGYRALDNTPFLAAQSAGALYIGKALYRYIGNISLDDYELNIREGTISVSSEAFYGKGILKSVHFSDSVEAVFSYAFWNSSLTSIVFSNESKLKYIGKYAFGLCRLNNPELPESLECIDDMAFNSYNPSLLKIPARVKKIGALYGTGSTNTDLRTVFEVVPENERYSSDECGVLYNKEKSKLIRASTATGKSFYVPDTVTEISAGAFRYLRSSQNIVLPDNLQYIGEEAFASWCYDKVYSEYALDFGLSEPDIGTNIFANDRYLSSVIVRSTNLTFPEGVFSAVTNENFTVYLMRGSAMQTYCDTYGINYEFLDYELRLGEINNLLSISEALDRTLYTDESIKALDEVISQVDLNLKNLTQEQVDEWTSAINNALSLLEYLPADYSALSEALKSARAVNRSLYTADSLLTLDSLVLNINYNANITQQAYVDKIAFDIIDAISALQYRGADYSAVNAAISNAVSVNRSMYTESSVNNLDTALHNVVYGLDITQQSRVNAFADSIELAITALVPKTADYTDVESALSRANAVNRTLYTEKSLKTLDDAVNQIDYNLNYDNQHLVAEYAQAINNAVDSLVYLPADYSSVDRAIAQANAIDRIMWSDSSLTALDQSISGVNRTLNVTQQLIVNAYAANILSKLNSLEYASVMLKNEPNGVIVSATSKEIYPTTSLSVDKLDPTNIENANFAVGGKVKTALYYDISLYRNSAKTQPDGTVVVKIKIPDGVDPNKCKVYHVTDDPVDPLVKFTSTLDGNYIVFETDHFSEFAVLEVETVLEGIVISSPPVKTAYAQGESFSRKGMIITAFFSDGRSAAIDDYDISVDTNTVGTKPLNVYYTFNGVTKSVSTVITVNKDNSIVPSEVVLHIPKDTTVEYRTKTTIVVSADNLPDDCSIVVSSGGTTVAKGKDSVKYYVGEIDSSITFLVRVVDKSGNTVTDSNGKPAAAEFKVNVNSSFFARLIAFFKFLFKALPEKEIKP